MCEDTIAIKSYLAKYPINSLILVCSNGNLTLKQIFKLLHKVKNNKHLLDLVFDSLKENPLINKSKEISETIKLAYLIIVKRTSYISLYGKNYYTHMLINDYNNSELLRIANDKKYLKDKQFMDSINFSSWEYILSNDNLIGWMLII